MKYVGIDIGGTFTDAVLLDTERGQLWKAKVSTTPTDLSECFRRGIVEVCREADVTLDQIDAVTHGSTVATNTVVEREGADLALVTTAGFRDVLEIGSTKRDDVFDVHWKKPEPLIPRRRRFEIGERLDAAGEELEPVDEREVLDVLERVDDSVDCLVVFLLHAYANPAHEREVAEILRTHTDRHVITSHEILPVYREFVRLSTTVLNGYVAPNTIEYLGQIRREVEALDGDIPTPLIATASGGQVPIRDAEARPGTLLFSGPSNGAVGAAFLGGELEQPDLINFDMGGTSCEVSLIENGAPSISTDNSVEGYPFSHPVVDINTIASGGGSIAWIDETGILRVGPQSAGADPGPACYGRGGVRPTVTDANLVLGRYNPDFFMGGEMELDAGRAEEAIREHVAEPLDIGVTEAAEGILRIINAKMGEAIKTMTVKRGTDPSEFVLVSFGGAGPSHIGFLMDELNVPEAICSPFSSVFSAFGLAINPVQFELQRTETVEDVRAEFDSVVEIFESLRAEGARRLRATGKQFQDVAFEFSVDAKYRGQRWETRLAVDEATLGERRPETLVEAFHETHERIYSYKQPAQDVLVTNFQVAAVGTTAEPRLERRVAATDGAEPPRRGHRSVVFDGESFDCPIYDGTRLRPGHELPGPSVVEHVDTTIVVPPRKVGVVDEFGNTILQEERA